MYNDIASKVERLLNDHGVWFEFTDYTRDRVVVRISGDWKHDHLRANWLISEHLGGVCLSECVVEEDGSDWYTADHTYGFVNGV